MTKLTYEIIEPTEFLSGFIRKTNENGEVWAVPIDQANSDYQRYLAWLENPQAELSTPIVAEE